MSDAQQQMFMEGNTSFYTAQRLLTTGNTREDAAFLDACIATDANAEDEHLLAMQQRRLLA